MPAGFSGMDEAGWPDIEGLDPDQRRVRVLLARPGFCRIRNSSVRETVTRLISYCNSRTFIRGSGRNTGRELERSGYEKGRPPGFPENRRVSMGI